MNSITFHQKQFAYQQIGEGFPIVFIHGFCEDSRIWEDFYAPLAFQKIIIDIPGFGQSQWIENYTLETVADGIKAVLDQLDIPECILIGHSMGGYISLAFANKYPECLKGFGLFHSHPYADTEEKKNNRTKSIEFVSQYGSEPFVKQLVPKLFSDKTRDNHQRVINTLIDRAKRYEPHAIAGALQAMRDRPDQSDVLKKAQSPVLFIVGNEDQAIPKPYSLEQTHLPERASINILEGIGHMGMFEDTANCQRMVEEFILFCLK